MYEYSTYDHLPRPRLAAGYGTTGMSPRFHCLRVKPSRRLGAVRSQERPGSRRTTAVLMKSSRARLTSRCSGFVKRDGFDSAYPPPATAGPVAVPESPGVE